MTLWLVEKVLENIDKWYDVNYPYSEESDRTFDQLYPTSKDREEGVETTVAKNNKKAKYF